jgi:hypothetical protein
MKSTNSKNDLFSVLRYESYSDDPLSSDFSDGPAVIIHYSSPNKRPQQQHIMAAYVTTDVLAGSIGGLLVGLGAATLLLGTGNVLGVSGICKSRCLGKTTSLKPLLGRAFPARDQNIGSVHFEQPGGVLTVLCLIC